ncbi:MAG: recombinase family protein [Chloroflexi bacterium]|nr:recombinase family protein [Chloroflexota bacterium]
MRAVAYFRLSDQTPDALASMEHDFKRFCTYNMHQPYQVFFTDGADVGTSDPGFRRMVDFLESSGSQFLVTVPDASHLGGDLESIARSIVELDNQGADIKCWDDEYPDPFQNTFNTTGIAGVSVARSRRVKEAMEARALEGNVLGRVLYGYRAGENGTLEIVPDEASVVELIFRLYTRDDLGFRLIAQELNERGIKTRRGGSWNVVSIRDIIRNRSYIGTYERFGIRRPGMHEAIVPREVFNEASERLKSRKPTGRIIRPEPFLLSGFVYCGYCGNKMMGVTRRQSWRRKTDNRRVTGVYRYYQCQSKNNQSTCDYHTWKEDRLEREALTQVKYTVLARAAGVLQDDGEEDRRREVANLRRDRVRKAERLFKRAMRRAAKNEIGTREVREYLAALDLARKSETRSEEPSDVIGVLDNWATLDLDRRKDFLWEHVGRIIVEDDKIEVEV